jgi:hypothetical protein
MFDDPGMDTVEMETAMLGRTGPSTLARSRWTAIGAAVAVSLGAGGVGLIAHAAGSAPSSFVSIAPCRLFDTRSSEAIGDRTTPLDADETFVRQVWGTNGNCTIPASATAISYNLTIPNGIDGYLTLYPADADRPAASSINPVTGQGVKVNGGIVGLSATGAVALYTLRGPLDAVLDITGYFMPAAGGAGAPGTPGAPGSPGTNGTNGARGLSAWDVIPSGTTVTGSIVYDTQSGGMLESDAVGVDLPGVAPVELTDATVNLGAGSGSGDDDPTCTGTNAAPTAPSGKVCIYIASNDGVSIESILAGAGQLPTRSFSMSFLSNVAAGADEVIYATWAYTAP